MPSHTLLLYGLTLASALLSTRVSGLQCFGCNVFHGQKYVDVGCGRPEVITCTHSHKGFKHRFCIKTESKHDRPDEPILKSPGLTSKQERFPPFPPPRESATPMQTLQRSLPALGIVLTSGCATSRHCQQQELPGVRIHCCDSDLCNSATRWPPHTLHLLLAALLWVCL